MKPPRRSKTGSPACWMAGLLLLVCAVLPARAWQGANPAKAAPKAAAPGTNAPPATNAAPRVVVIPKSVFEVADPSVKDPFFPLSTRRPASVTTTNAPAGFTAASFHLMALSGPPTRRLAIINNRTFGTGEDGEVSTPQGKVKIHCIEVKESSVIISVANQIEVLEVRFRKGL